MTSGSARQGVGHLGRARRPAVRRWALGLCAVLLACLAMMDTAEAAGWTEQEFARFRLLPGATAAGDAGEILIGLEVELQPGWQFYSEDPGPYGVAPVFDWSASRNLARAAIHWPAPTRYVYSSDPPIDTLGYKDALLLPVLLEPRAAGEALQVRLSLEYAVCEAYCVIESVELRLALPAGRGEATPHAGRLEEALAQAATESR